MYNPWTGTKGGNPGGLEGQGEGGKIGKTVIA